MSRISKTFDQCRKENRKALVVFVSAGNPNLDSSEQLTRELIKAGADIIELGVPFSDPMADGPVIQESSVHALAGGTTLPGIVAMAKRLRAQCETPIILFSYYNVILSYGLEKLAADSVDAGIDGWLIVDVPFEESDEVRPVLDQHGLDLIQLVAPTTPHERAVKIVKNATGFIYYITVKGVTGARSELPADLREKLADLRQAAPAPVVAGFGISTPEMARASAEHADGIVVGSALVKLMTNAATPSEGIRQSVDLTAKLAAALK